MTPDGYGDDALNAYVDGAMSLEERASFEAWLADHPDVAARVMADISVIHALRATEPPPPLPAPALVDAARQLQSGLRRSPWRTRTVQGAVAAGLVAVGWIGHANLAPPTRVPEAPAEFVAQAQGAAASASLEQAITEEPPATRQELAAVGSETDVPLPDLPAGWRVDDVQIYPWTDGHGVMITATAARLGEVRLFAAAVGTSETLPPTEVGTADGRSVYWQVDDVGYTLMGKASSRDLKRAADTMARSVL